MKTDAEGKATDFAGNEKCAAGAGSFAEAMSRALQLTLKEFGEASLRSEKSIPMNAQCTVFAESEVVSLIHSATPKEDIAKAVLDAVASRVCAMVRRVGIEGEVVLIGGMGHNPGFVRSLKDAMGVDQVSLPELPEYVSAVGCALIAAERLH
jgi:benzoyl-CoA reductase subunit D